MSKSNINLYEIVLPIFRHYRSLCKTKSNGKDVLVVMTEITEDEEKEIDNLKDKVIKLKRGDKTFKISNNQIYCYGEVNFNDEKDLETIDNFPFLNYLVGTGIKVCSNYNYETHSCTSPKKRPLWTETWSPAFLAKYTHASLGKPKRIILFKTN